jgi:hypothetical protein
VTANVAALNLGDGFVIGGGVFGSNTPKSSLGAVLKLEFVGRVTSK